MLYRVLVTLVRGVGRVLFRFRKPDNSLVPKENGILVCANHPSWRDPIFVAISLNRQLTFMAKKELFRFKPFARLISALGAFPIDRGGNDLTAIKTAIRLLKNGSALLLFPQGTRSMASDHTDGKNGAVRLAIMTGAKILPVGISENTRLFSKATVRLGTPIDYSEYQGKHLTDQDYTQLTEKLMKDIYSLVDTVPMLEEKSHDNAC